MHLNFGQEQETCSLIRKKKFEMPESDTNFTWLERLDLRLIWRPFLNAKSQNAKKVSKEFNEFQNGSTLFCLIESRAEFWNHKRITWNKSYVRIRGTSYIINKNCVRDSFLCYLLFIDHCLDSEPIVLNNFLSLNCVRK